MLNIGMIIWNWMNWNNENQTLVLVLVPFLDLNCNELSSFIILDWIVLLVLDIRMLLCF